MIMHRRTALETAFQKTVTTTFYKQYSCSDRLAKRASSISLNFETEPDDKLINYKCTFTLLAFLSLTKWCPGLYMIRYQSFVFRYVRSFSLFVNVVM